MTTTDHRAEAAQQFVELERVCIVHAVNENGNQLSTYFRQSDLSGELQQTGLAHDAKYAEGGVVLVCLDISGEGDAIVHVDALQVWNGSPSSGQDSDLAELVERIGHLEPHVRDLWLCSSVPQALERISRMVDARRFSPEPPWGGSEIVRRPDMADDLMRELAPILAGEGIDLNDPDSIPDLETLQHALDRAVERRNMELFTPVGEARSLALTTLRLYVEAIASEQTELAGAILATAVPEPLDGPSVQPPSPEPAGSH